MPIEVKHLTHIYAPGTPFESRAVDDVSFTVNDGDFVGLIGHTGSGKSTLIQHLNALLKPAGGQVLVDGEDIHQPGRSLSARLKVGLVFQYPEYQLFEETVRKDVGFGPRNLGLSDAEVDARVSEALRRVGLSEGDWEKSPFELSGGQKRRAAIAGVLLCSTYHTLMPTTGSMPGIKAFTAAVFGGIGSIPGALLGGLLLGIIEILGKAYVSMELGDALVFAVLIIVLLVKPTGLLGKPMREKV